MIHFVEIECVISALSCVWGALDYTVRDIEMLEFVDFVEIKCVIFTLSCAAVSGAH